MLSNNRKVNSLISLSLHKTGYMKYQSILIFLFIVIYSQLGSFAQNHNSAAYFNKIEQAKKQCNTPCLNDTVIIKSYLAWGDDIYLQYPDSALHLWLQAEKLSTDLLSEVELSDQDIIGLKKHLNYAISSIGYIYDNKGNIDSALFYYEKDLSIAKELGDKRGIASTLNNIGIIYKNKGEIIKALEYYDQSLKMKEEAGDKQGVAISYNNIGYIYYNQNDIPKSLEYLSKGLELVIELRDTQMMANSYNNLGYIYNEEEEISKALDYYLKALTLRESLQDKQGMANSYNNIGGIYEFKQEISKALSYYEKSLKIRQEIGDKQGIATSLINIANINLELEDINLAKEKFLKAYKISKELGFPDEIKIAAEGLKNVYELQGNIPKAYQFFKEEIQMRDSIQNEDNSRATQKQQAMYEYLKQAAIDSIAHQNEIKFKNLELEKSEAVKEKQRITILFFIIGFVIILLFAIVILRMFIQKKKANKLLAFQNNEINQQKEEIQAQRDEITEHRDIVLKQKEEIEDSIQYAQKIQSAVIPSEKYTNQILNDYFIIFRPHSIVSGDFYWVQEVNDWQIVTVADCTGHGVPGAFMSMLGISFITEIVRKKEITNAAEVLNQLRTSIIESLNQTKDVESQKDGMDMSLVAINKNTNICFWAGANNPLWIIRADNTTNKDKDPIDII